MQRNCDTGQGLLDVPVAAVGADEGKKESALSVAPEEALELLVVGAKKPTLEWLVLELLSRSAPEVAGEVCVKSVRGGLVSFRDDETDEEKVVALVPQQVSVGAVMDELATVSVAVTVAAATAAIGPLL